MTFKKPVAGRTFLPDNATLVRTADGAPVASYRSELEEYLNHKSIATIMRERTSVCGRG